MGAIWLHQLPDVLRAAGLSVATYDGWETRARGSGGYDRILAVGIHHDASPAGTPQANRWNYEWRVANDRPIGCMHLGPDGSVMIGAAGATNTQGKGGPYPTSRGTIPQDQGNRYMISVEASNDGVGEVWPNVQQDAYLTLCAALCDEFDLSRAQDVVAHFEWTSRKIDPAGPSRWAAGSASWNMQGFRGSLQGLDPTPAPPDPEWPPYMPPTSWGLYPLDCNKPSLKKGSPNTYGHVTYLQDVIYFYAGGNITRDGVFGSETAKRVMDVQRMFDFPDAYVDGICGWNGPNCLQAGDWATWEAIDLIRGIGAGGTPGPEPGPGEGVVEVNPGYYWVRSGDSPWAASERIYGSANPSKLQPTNPASPGFNAPNHLIRTPGVSGLRATVEAGEGPYAVLSRMGFVQSGANLDRFYDFNGGESRVLHPGDAVFMPA